VFFPGTGLSPVDYRLLLETVALQGFAVVGLSYANDKDVDRISDPSDPNCTERARLEILSGDDLSSRVDVTRDDSAIGRLVGLLAFLELHHPGEGWGDFVAGGQPRWSSIVASGHSLGGGEAALIGLKHHVARVVLLSAPNDRACGVTSAPAPWEVAGALTAPASWFGLGHVWDVRDEPLELSAWNALGLASFGLPQAVVNVEKAAPPYDNAHELTTDALPAACQSQEDCSTNDAHRSTAVDANTPLDGDTPHLLDAWRYLFGS
jgi:hypothetical protein